MAIRVLIFEDNHVLREALSDMIENTEGFLLVGGYGDCIRAEDLTEKHMPDVILMDIEMPGRDGVSAVNPIKRRFPAVDVLMLTVFDDDDRIFQSIKSGATGYLLKKTTPARIMEAISEVYEGGAPMSPSIARRVMAEMQLSQRSPAEHFSQLTPRELQILHLLSEGMSYKMVAADCGISLETARTHIKRIYEKLHVRSVTEAIGKYLKR